MSLLFEEILSKLKRDVHDTSDQYILFISTNRTVVQKIKDQSHFLRIFFYLIFPLNYFERINTDSIKLNSCKLGKM